MFRRARALRLRKTQTTGRSALSPLPVFVALVAMTLAMNTQAAAQATDPGVRAGGAGNTGNPVTGLTPNQQAFFAAGLEQFAEIQSVTGTVANTSAGLGPRFNGEGCGQCHSQPAIGGTSPASNPQIVAANDQGATNQIPFFVTANGPVREARFPLTPDLRQPDGGVHDLFTITGRGDAKGCNISQPDFQQAARDGNLIFRIPTPVFGDGLIQSIPESLIRGQIALHTDRKRDLGIGGRPNTSGNDGTITRFGWKAQNKSVGIFAGEAYNVEVGVTNELFPNERDETPGCLFNGTPEDITNFDQDGTQLPSDVSLFTTFMEFLDQPQPAPSTPSTVHGQQVFVQIGCALCHTPSFTTGQSSVAALSNIPANLFSDLLLHHMGPKLADGISQGAAGRDEFRTAPLWGLGQRIFFLHDGRTSDLVKAIHEHHSHGDRHYPDSEANGVVVRFKGLSVQDQQDLLNFLRSL
ncbi:MAG: di-heme oxidoredictase family protein [Candidatus Sulfotelmatobacter sp.]